MTEVATPIRKVQMTYEEARRSEQKYRDIVEATLVPLFMDIFYDPQDPDSYYERAHAAAESDDPEKILPIFSAMLARVKSWDTYEMDSGKTLLKFYTRKIREGAEGDTDVGILLNNLQIVRSRLVSSSLLSSKSFAIPSAEDTIFMFFKCIAYYYRKNMQFFNPYNYMAVEGVTWNAMQKGLGKMIKIGPPPPEPEEEPEPEPQEPEPQEQELAPSSSDEEPEEPEPGDVYEPPAPRVDIEDVEI